MLELNDDNFDKEVLKSDKPVVVDFFANWCGPCKAMSPIIEELSNEMKNVKFAKLNVDDFPELASTYGVMGIPNFIVFKDGDVSGNIVGSGSDFGFDGGFGSDNTMTCRHNGHFILHLIKQVVCIKCPHWV